MKIIEIESQIPCLKECKAHSKQMKNGVLYESWKEHTLLCQQYFSKLYDEKNVYAFLKRYTDKLKEFYHVSDAFFSYFEEMFQDVILFHDIGKLNPEFQKQKMKQDVSYVLNLDRGSEHSIISAIGYIGVWQFRLQELRKEKKITWDDMRWLDFYTYVFGYCIKQHHSGLDSFSDFISKDYHFLFEQLSKVISCFYVVSFVKMKKRCCTIIDFDFLAHDVIGIEHMACVRMLFSLLVTSDFYATSQFCTGISIDSFGHVLDVHHMREVYEKSDNMQYVRNYEKIKNQFTFADLSMNQLRSQLFLDTDEKLMKNQDASIFYLRAPTGAGKTNLSLNLCLDLLEHSMGLNKLLFVYPFNNLIEQTEQSIRNLFQNDKRICNQIHVVNSLTPIAFQDNYELSLLNRQFLNYGIVLTTNVHLFDMLFGNTRSSVFGFHQLMNTVIVLDEVQAYRYNIWPEFIYFMRTYGPLLNMKCIIMSATLPCFDVLIRDKDSDLLVDTVNLVDNADDYFCHDVFKNRVQIHMDLLDADMSMILEHMKVYLQKGKRLLCEFITKKSAYAFYELANASFSDFADVELMTGDDKKDERQRIIHKIKHHQTGDRGLLLVATQVIEAGVDISMHVGYKSISLLDCDEQFMGRINRSHEMKMGDVWFFQKDKPSQVYRLDSRSSKEYTLESSDMQKVLEKKDFVTYYIQVMQGLVKRVQSYGLFGLQQFLKSVCNLDFTSIAKQMKLIEDNKYKTSVFFARKQIFVDDKELNGQDIWLQYQSIRHNKKLDYAEHMYKLKELEVLMSYFIYEIPQRYVDCMGDAMKFGNLYYVDDGDAYFLHNKLNWDCFPLDTDLIL